MKTENAKEEMNLNPTTGEVVGNADVVGNFIPEPAAPAEQNAADTLRVEGEPIVTPFRVQRSPFNGRNGETMYNYFIGIQIKRGKVNLSQAIPLITRSQHDVVGYSTLNALFAADLPCFLCATPYSFKSPTDGTEHKGWSYSIVADDDGLRYSVDVKCQVKSGEALIQTALQLLHTIGG